MNKMFVESAHEVPLAWFSLAFPGGSAADPVGLEGLASHAAQLARRGAGDRDRTALDEAIDSLGADLSMAAGCDAMSLSGMCLSRNLGALMELAADVLARPQMLDAEHEKLRRETLNELDDFRDDDGWVALRHFSRLCLPGYTYSRTSIGTEDSLRALTRQSSSDELAASVCADAAVVGFAGDVSEEQARQLADSALADIAQRTARPVTDLKVPTAPTGRRLFLVDKPKRTQSQLMLGHLGPRYGTDGWLNLSPVETTFGGMFTSRLMQEIRVARGWSYGAGCRVNVARGPHWFRMSLAPSAEVTPDALALTLSMFDSLCADGITEDELRFAVRFMTGSLPFARATARQRMQQAMRLTLYGLPLSFPDALPERLAQISLEDTRAAITQWLHPRDLCIVMVATAETMLPALENSGALATIDDVEVVAYDAY